MSAAKPRPVLVVGNAKVDPIVRGSVLQKQFIQGIAFSGGKS